MAGASTASPDAVVVRAAAVLSLVLLLALQRVAIVVLSLVAAIAAAVLVHRMAAENRLYRIRGIDAPGGAP